MQHIENLCNQFSNITIKPLLYDLLIKDFTILADLYISNSHLEFNLSLNPEYDHVLTRENIEDLLHYLCKDNNAEKILISIIQEKTSDTIVIDVITLKSIIDYYIDSFVLVC